MYISLLQHYSLRATHHYSFTLKPMELYKQWSVYFQVTSSPGFNSLQGTKGSTFIRLYQNMLRLSLEIQFAFSKLTWGKSNYSSYLLYSALLFLNAVSFWSCCLSRYHPITKPMGTNMCAQFTLFGNANLTMVPTTKAGKKIRDWSEMLVYKSNVF